MANYFDDLEDCNREAESGEGSGDFIIPLYDEATDKEEEFYVLDTIDYDNRWFTVMKPVKPVSDIADDEVLIMEIVNDGEGIQSVDDEKILGEVFDKFMALVEESEGGED